MKCENAVISRISRIFPKTDEKTSEIAALAQAVDRGINQLREMGILDLTTEAEARRILQDNGGNVEAAINTILQ